MEKNRTLVVCAVISAVCLMGIAFAVAVASAVAMRNSSDRNGGKAFARSALGYFKNADVQNVPELGVIKMSSRNNGVSEELTIKLSGDELMAYEYTGEGTGLIGVLSFYDLSSVKGFPSEAANALLPADNSKIKTSKTIDGWIIDIRRDSDSTAITVRR